MLDKYHEERLRQRLKGSGDKVKRVITPFIVVPSENLNGDIPDTHLSEISGFTSMKSYSSRRSIASVASKIDPFQVKPSSDQVSQKRTNHHEPKAVTKRHRSNSPKFYHSVTHALDEFMDSAIPRQAPSVSSSRVSVQGYAVSSQVGLFTPDRDHRPSTFIPPSPDALDDDFVYRVNSTTPRPSFQRASSSDPVPSVREHTPIEMRDTGIEENLEMQLDQDKQVELQLDKVPHTTTQEMDKVHLDTHVKSDENESHRITQEIHSVHSDTMQKSDEVQLDELNEAPNAALDEEASIQLDEEKLNEAPNAALDDEKLNEASNAALDEEVTIQQDELIEAPSTALDEEASIQQDDEKLNETPSATLDEETPIQQDELYEAPSVTLDEEPPIQQDEEPPSDKVDEGPIPTEVMDNVQLDTHHEFNEVTDVKMDDDVPLSLDDAELNEREPPIITQETDKVHLENQDKFDEEPNTEMNEEIPDVEMDVEMDEETPIDKRDEDAPPITTQEIRDEHTDTQDEAQVDEEPIISQEMDNVHLNDQDEVDVPPITTQEINNEHVDAPDETPVPEVMDTFMEDDYGYDEQEEEEPRNRFQVEEEEALLKVAPVEAKRLGAELLKTIRFCNVQIGAIKRECVSEVAKIKDNTQDILENGVLEDYKNRVIEKLGEHEDDYIKLNEMTAYLRRFELHGNQVSKKSGLIAVETLKVDREIAKLEEELESIRNEREKVNDDNSFLNSVQQLIHPA